MSFSQRLKQVCMGVHQVVNSDDIMSEILLLLPPETVYNLILVSKRWLQIISNPFFRRTYLTKWKMTSELIGFFICKPKNSGSFKYELRVPPSEFDHPSRTILDEQIKSLKQLGHYIGSSKGFILCNGYPKDNYLWNPSTGKRHRIPQPKVLFEFSSTSLIVDDYPFSYKVIRADCVNKPSAKLKVEIFSSKTNIWSYSELTCPESTMILVLGNQGGEVVNGVVYWYATGGRVAIYDSNSDKKRVDLVKLPKIHDSDKRVLAGSDDGCLRYGRCNKSVMEIWKLEKLSGGVFQWKHQHKVNFKVVWRWFNVKGERFSSTRNDVRKMLAFPIRNETQTCSLKPETITQTVMKGWKEEKEEEQGVPYGMSAMSCHSFVILAFLSFSVIVKELMSLRSLGKNSYVTTSLPSYVSEFALITLRISVRL